MKRKLSINWLFSVIFIIGLLSTLDSSAQLSQADPARDSLNHGGSHTTRARFNEWDDHQQLIFLNNSPFTIDDLVNVTADDLINHPEWDYRTPYEFYNEFDPQKQQAFLIHGDKFKIYARVN